MAQLIWCCLPDGSSEFFNAAFYAFTGMTHDATVGTGWQCVLHPDDRIELANVKAHSILVAQPFKVALRIQAIGGTFQPFELHGEPVLDASAAVEKWLYSASPDDNASFHERYSLENDRYFREVVDAIPGMVCTLTTDMQTEYCNQALLDFYGLPLEEIRNWATNGATHPDDIPPSIAQTKHSIATGEGFDVERRLRRFDGEFRWIRLSGKPLRDAGGRIVRWYLSLTDIHEAKLAETAIQASEQRLRVAIDTMPVLAWSSKADGDVTFFNQQWRDYTGLSTEEAQGWRWAQAIHPEHAKMLPARWERTLASGQGSQLEALFRRHDGEYRWFLIRANPLRNEQGQIVQWYGTNTDIHDLKMAEEALMMTRGELASATRLNSLGVLTASIAHEVNQPLTGIVTNASSCVRMLSSTPPNIAGALETSRRTIRDANRAADIIIRIKGLFIHRPGDIADVDLCDAMKEVIELQAAEIRRGRVSIRLALDEGLPTIIGDRLQLQQVMLNLLRNAIDALSSIDTRARDLVIRTDISDESIGISFTDVGVGYGENTAKKLFEPFHSTKPDGMGIGLSVSRSIMEAHGGTLWARRNEPFGATFGFSVPLEL